MSLLMSSLMDDGSGSSRGGVARPAFESNGLRLERLASYQSTPGTVAFLGQAVDLAERDPRALRELRAQADGLFLKLAYQFRRYAYRRLPGGSTSIGPSAG